MELRDYQRESVEKAMDYIKSNDHRPGLIAAPTAAGKSLIISNIAYKSNSPVLVLQPKKELLEQNLEKLESFGGKATVYSASMGIKEVSDLTYATLGSIKNDAKKFRDIGVKTVLIDEADSGYPPEKESMFMKFISALGPEKVIGLTATPFRLKSTVDRMGNPFSQLVMLTRSRPKFFKHFINVIQIQEMVKRGYWSKLEYHVHDYDNSILSYNSTGSDFTDSSVKKANEKMGVNNNIYLKVKELVKEEENRILVFVDSVETAQTLSQWVPNSESISGKTSKKERNRIIKDFKDNKIRVLFNYGVLSVGFDYPRLNHVIMGRPTNSLAVLYQIIGRATRPHKLKKLSHVWDYGGNIDRFGRMEDLVIEDYPGYGWGVFNKDVLLTGVPMGGLKVRKKDIGVKKNGETSLWFGKYEGKKVSDLPVRYIKWLLDWMDTLPSMAKKMEALKSELKNLLKNDSI